MKLGIGLGELYFEQEDGFISSSVSYNFFDKIKEWDYTVMCAVGNGHKAIPPTYNAFVPKNSFLQLPFFDSIHSFMVQYFFSKSFRDEMKVAFELLIESNDVIWCRNPAIVNIYLAEYALKHNKRVVSHICADIESSWKNPKYQGIKKTLARLMSAYILRKLKTITKHEKTITLCTGTKLFEQFKPLNRNVHYFIDSLIEQKDLVSHAGMGKKFLFVGRLNIEKGILDLIEAAHILKKLNFEFSLEIIGFGNLEETIKERICQYDLKTEVNFIGYVPHGELHKYYKNNDFFILPSNADYEGFPRVILEAWSYGLPVITTDVGGIRGLGKENKNLIFVERTDASSIAEGMKRLISENELRPEMEKYIHENRENITFEFYKDYLKSVLEG